jgi:toxin with endonuclease activity of toxin-antitoxin system
VQRNGWNLFQHPPFKKKLEELTAEVERLATSDPVGYTHPKTKLLDTIRRHILEIITANPNAPEFRQGNTLGRGQPALVSAPSFTSVLDSSIGSLAKTRSLSMPGSTMN